MNRQPSTVTANGRFMVGTVRPARKPQTCGIVSYCTCCSAMSGASHISSPVFVDISGFLMIKIVLASIDALVEKEVIPEVSEDLSCTEGACDLASALFLSPAAFSVNAIKANKCKPVPLVQ